jgi:GNAT superfamily N-acetyltransferase
VAAIDLRRARPEDADVIAHIHTAARHQAMPYLPDLHTDEETRDWIASMVLPSQQVWVAEREGRVIGVAALEGPTLEQLYVLPEEQGRGVGSALLEKARELSSGGLTLWTFQRNAAARAFYERRGFTAVKFTDGSGNEEQEPDVRYEWVGKECQSPRT